MPKMSENNVEFKLLDARCIGTDTVVFRLEDGSMVKVKVDIQRAGVAVGTTNPDGTPQYDISPALKLSVVPTKKSYYVPKARMQIPSAGKPKEMPFIR
jgi:hypothetical protein